MDPSTWKQIETILDRILHLEKSERTLFIEKHVDDPELKREINALLEAEFNAPRYLDQGIDAFLTGNKAIHEITANFSLETFEIDRYQVEKEIGRGGMSVVYLAHRADGEFDRKVAVKIIQPFGLDREDRYRRLRAERQILANLQHPNIARVFDGGVTPEGWPYMVMELVDGIPVTNYCREKNLDLTSRLELFQNVCDAVIYAHRNLVVHRDLKPGNILVTQEGQVKLLDFGIAKLLTEDESSPVTQTGRPLMTPEYAAPEQFKGETITTSVDVYSLGVILYELLTEVRPYDLADKSVPEMERLVCEEEPVKPSEKNTASVIPSAKLKGDLNLICMKVLRKEPEKRYQSVEELKEDVGRYLSGLPVTARATTVIYRIRKFVRRHRAGVAVMILFFFILAGFIATLIHQQSVTLQERNRAQQEADRANQVTQFLINVFEEADPENARGDTLNAYQILERGVNRLETEMAGQPAQQAAIENAIGQVYRKLGNYDQAQTLTEQSLATRKRLYGHSHPDVAASLASLGELYQRIGDFAKADSSFREALAIIDMTYGKDHPLWIQYRNGQGKVLLETGSYEEAESLFRDAIETGERIHGRIHPEVAFSYDYLARSLKEQGDSEAALPYTEQALHITRELYGNEHPAVAAYLANLGSIYFNMGNDRTAERYHRESLDLYKIFLGENHPHVAAAYGNLAATLSNQGQTEEAIQLHQKSQDILQRFYGEAHPHIAAGLHNLGNDLRVIGRYDEAESAFQEMLAIDQELLGNEHPIVGTDKHMLAAVLRDKQLYNEALLMHKEALDVLLATLPADHRQVGHARTGYGITLLLQGNIDEAERSLQDGIAILSEAYTDGHWSLDDARAWLGACFTKHRQYEEAEKLLINAYTNLQKDRGSDDRYTLQAARHLTELYDTWNKPEKAAEYRNLLADQK